MTRALAFAARPGLHFWSNGAAWGTCRIRADKARRKWSVAVEVTEGALKIRSLRLQGVGEASVKRELTSRPGKPAVFTL